MANLLAGKRALVTGSASGIGAAIVAEFVAQGAIVFGVDKNPSAHQPSTQFTTRCLGQCHCTWFHRYSNFNNKWC